MPDLTLNEELYLQMCDALPDAVYLVLPIFKGSEQIAENIIDFEFVYSNKLADNIAHLGNLKGRKLYGDEIFDSQSRQQAFQHYLEVWTSGEKKEFTYYNASVQQSLDILRCKFQNGVLNILRDRTNQRIAEEKEKEQTEKLHAVIKNSPNGIMVFSSVRDENNCILDFKVTLWNDVGAKLVNYSDEELNNMTLNCMVDLRGEHEIHNKWKQVVETGETFDTDYYFDSLKKWLHINVVKLADGFMTTYTDITYLKQFHETVERSAKRLNTIINSSQVGIFTLTPVWNEEKIVDFRFGIVNPAVAAYIGQTAEILKGDIGSKWFPGYLTNGLFDIYIDTYFNNKSHHFQFHYEDGYDVYFDILTLKVDDEILVTFNDLTSVKKLQLQLEKSVEELRQSNKNLEEFAYVASHDLQEPLRKINFFSDRLKTTLSEGRIEESEKMLERIQAGSKRMQVLIEDLLTYSSISIKKKNFEEVHLSEIITQVLADLDTTIADKNAVISVDELPTIKGDRQQLSQLFSNLISNSLKYSKPDLPPEVKITCAAVEGSTKPLGIENIDGKYYLIEVADNGIGFEQQYAQRIFQVFQRLHGKQEYPGTGVGLAIADKVVANHHGFIMAESQVGTGATFKILLPASLQTE